MENRIALNTDFRLFGLFIFIHFGLDLSHTTLNDYLCDVNSMNGGKSLMNYTKNGLEKKKRKE